MKFFIVLLFSALAFAQTQTRPIAGEIGGVIGGASASIPAAVVTAPGWTFTSAGPGAQGGGVKGMPYSAEQVTEQVQTLADGTHITQPGQKVRFYRDSQGRTRTETTFPMPPGAAASDPPTVIQIFDPVTGDHYTLDSRSHTARKLSIPPPPPPPPPPPSSAANRTAQIIPAIAPPPANSAPRPQISRESLGTQSIEGVLAEGTRMTTVYPIGAVGNDRPITSVSETWTSRELNTVVLSKNSDPRSGESTTRLTNISRAEPDLSLFQIPADYEVVDPQTGARR